MELKAIVNKEVFFQKIIKSKCNFKRVCNLYPAKCKNVKYIGQLKNFKEMEVFQINKNEAKFFKTVFKLFKNSKISILYRKEINKEQGNGKQ